MTLPAGPAAPVSPSSPRFWRRAETFFLAAAALSVAFTGIAVGQGRFAPEIGFDRWAAPGVHRALSTAWKPLFLALSFFGGAPFVFSATAVAAGVLWRMKARRRFEALVVGVGGAALLVQVFKILLHRARPRIFEPLAQAVGFGFPSGHSASAAAFYGTLAAIAAVSTRSPGRSAGFLAAGLLIVFAIGFSRVWLGVHWPTDVVGGWALGFGWLALVFAVNLPRGKARRSGAL